METQEESAEYIYASHPKLLKRDTTTIFLHSTKMLHWR